MPKVFYLGNGNFIETIYSSNNKRSFRGRRAELVNWSDLSYDEKEVDAILSSFDLKEKNMTIKQDVDFINKATDIVADYVDAHLDKTDKPVEYQVYMVWYCKTLQNFKGLFSTSLTDGMYYEITYNGDKDQIYLDAYKKFENKCYDL